MNALVGHFAPLPVEATVLTSSSVSTSSLCAPSETSAAKRSGRRPTHRHVVPKSIQRSRIREKKARVLSNFDSGSDAQATAEQGGAQGRLQGEEGSGEKNTSGGVGCVYSLRSSVGAGPSSHATFRIGGLLGFSRCPCFSGKLSPIARFITRSSIKKNGPNSVHYQSRRNLVSRSQLPTHDGDTEESTSEDQKASFDGRTSPSVVDASDQGEGPGSSKGQQPRIPYGLVTALASVGFVETSYLTWAKLSGTSVACTVGGSCMDVLDGTYATVFGIPLAFVGMLIYGGLAVLGGIRLLNSSSETWAEEEKWIRWLTLGITTSMGAASVYFMYILIVKLEGASCAYCASSAVLSLSLLLSSLRGFTTKDSTKMAGLQVAAGALVVLALSVAYDGADAAQDLDLPPVEPEVVASSSPRVISLAKHLQSVGARMYGAFWCSHCHEQKEMFGREAMKYVDYVECYPEGYRKGVPIAKACDAANIQGFPTWIIKGRILSGEQELDDLANASDFDRSEY